MSQSATARDGVLLERENVVYFDTRALAWEPLPGRPGARRKVLTRDAQGAPRAFLFHLPPGFAPAGLPQRHTHRSVTELTLALAGELPQWEYLDAGQQHGTLVRQRPGYVVHRRPGSLHGLEPGPRTTVGFTGLMIRTGSGTASDEPGFAEETVDVPYAAAWQPAADAVEARPEPGSGIVIDRPGVSIIDSEAQGWTEPGRYGCSKVLARDAAGSPLLTMQHVNPDFALPGHPERHSHPHDEHNFMLWGEFTIAEFERGGGPGRRMLMKAGCFAQRRAGDIHGLVTGPGGTVDET